MAEETQRALSSSREKRGVARASITRLRTKVAKLEGSPGPDSLDIARRFTTRLETLDAEYKVHHYAIVDLLDDEGDLGREQEILDEHDDEMSQQLFSADGHWPAQERLQASEAP